MAAWLQEQGQRVVCIRGRFWKNTAGFYQPVHWLARLRKEEIVHPGPLCWGYRTSLAAQDRGFANGSMPVNLLSDIESYDIGHMPSKRRNQLRKCRKLVEIVQLTGSSLLEEQGYDVYRSARERLGLPVTLQKDPYAKAARKLVGDRRCVVLAGLIGGRLGGYLDAYAVDRAAYVWHVYIATDMLGSNIGTGLAFDFVQICRRTGRTNEVAYGLNSREKESLNVFKSGMGFPVVNVPARVWMLPLMSRIVRWRRPHAHYRLTGQP